MLMMCWAALQVDLWDINKISKVRSFAGHSKHVTALSWNSHLLSSAGGEGVVLNRDMRVPEDSVATMKGHRSTISGLKVSFLLPWMHDNQYLCATNCFAHANLSVVGRAYGLLAQLALWLCAAVVS